MAAATTPLLSRPAGVLARSEDAPLVGVAVMHASVALAIVALDPRGTWALVAAAILGISIVYSANTVSHWHLHRPLFVSRTASRALSLLLTATLLVPQTAWKHRHLWHHAGEPAPRPRLRVGSRLVTELALVAAVLAALGWLRPHALTVVITPAFALGMLLARVQGHFEHEGDADRAQSGVSHYGWLYNTLWFNDGHHAEHHRFPNAHWADLRRMRRDPVRVSTHAPLLRWADWDSRLLRAWLLGALERIVPRSSILERWVVGVHARALGSMLGELGPIQRVLVVGGGLFPRTVLALRALAIDAELVVVDADQANIELARRALVARGASLPTLIHASFDPERHRGFDLVVFPLALVGSETLVARACDGNAHVLTHDWLTTRTARSRVVSLWLWKRLNLREARA